MEVSEDDEVNISYKIGQKCTEMDSLEMNKILINNYLAFWHKDCKY